MATGGAASRPISAPPGTLCVCVCVPLYLGAVRRCVNYPLRPVPLYVWLYPKALHFGGGDRLFADFRAGRGVSWNLTSAKTKNECIWIVGDLYEQQQQWCLRDGDCLMIQRHTVCMQTEI